MAENHLTPEELTDELLAETKMDPKAQDQIYLLIFELWRRLLPEKPCLSVFCNELDHQIHQYDKGHSDRVESIQDALANLQVILDENTDEGANPVSVFDSISACCANDIESFLYDFIAEQIDNLNYSYASELLDGFNEYIKDVKWFDFLRARILAPTDSEGANQMIRQIVQETSNDKDLEFNLELLSFMVQAGERDVFVKLVKQTIKLLEFEEDFQDLLNICADYFHRFDLDNVEQKLQKLINDRSQNMFERQINPKDPHFSELMKIIA